jgi:type II secretory pathway pseudopilin PulG
MLVVTFIIAIVALIISILAYQRTGGTKELRKTVDSLSSTMESLKGRAEVGLKEQIETLSSVTESLRDRPADAIDRLEKALRGRPEEKPPEEKPPEEKPPRPKRPRAKRE